MFCIIPAAEPTTSIKSKSGLFADEEEENDMFAVKEQKIASSKRKVSVPECISKEH